MLEDAFKMNEAEDGPKYRGSATGPALQNQNRGSPTRCPSDGLHMHAPLACGRIWYEREIPLKLLYSVLRSDQLQASSSDRWD